MQTRSIVRLSSFLLLPVCMLALAVGCSHSPRLVVRSQAKHKAYAQNFSQAVANTHEDGMYEFVLISDEARPNQQKKHEAARLISSITSTLTGSNKKPADEPLDPSKSMPLHQVVHVKVLWRPLNGTDPSVGSNASLVWYVLSDTAEGEGDLLEYQGSAYVEVDPKDDVTKVTIHDGTIKPRACRGGLIDPIGPARIEGKFVAVNDAARLRQVLSSTRARARTAASAMAQ
jgi:hypothetical protein